MLCSQKKEQFYQFDLLINFKLIHNTQGRNRGKFLQWWAESAPLGWDRVKVSENLGATSVPPVVPVVTSLVHLKPLAEQVYKGGLKVILLQQVNSHDFEPTFIIFCLN